MKPGKRSANAGAVGLAAVIMLTGCMSSYAELYVKPFRSTDRAEPADCRIFRADDGTYLGRSREPIQFVKSRLDRKPVLPLLVEGDGYRTRWMMIRISRWAPTELEAKDARYQNEVLVELEPLSRKN